MRPVIYLDFDGVVATTRAAVGKPNRRHEDDPIAFGILRRICEETNAQIVVTSTWRLHRTDDCRSLFEKYELTPFLHADLFTGNTNSRSAEIEAHRSAHGIDTFIIIDDERNDFTTAQLQWLVHTDMQFGLGVYDYDRAVRLLGVKVIGRAHEGSYQSPRLTLANHALAAKAALRDGDLARAHELLAIIAEHPLAQ